MTRIAMGEEAWREKFTPRSPTPHFTVNQDGNYAHIHRPFTYIFFTLLLREEDEKK